MEFVIINVSEIVSTLGGAIAIGVGLSELKRSNKDNDKLSEGKYRKVNVLHLVMPGIVLIGIGSLVLSFPLMIRLAEINRAADIVIAVHDKNSKKSESEKAAEEKCSPAKESSKVPVPANCIGNLIYQGEKK